MEADVNKSPVYRQGNQRESSGLNHGKPEDERRQSEESENKEVSKVLEEGRETVAAGEKVDRGSKNGIGNYKTDGIRDGRHPATNSDAPAIGKDTT